MPSDLPNWILSGDNLKVLPRLARTHGGRFRLVYLDPPYAKGRRFDHYDDPSDVDAWLDRFEALITAIGPLMREDGVWVVQLDDTLQARAQILLDGFLGSSNRINTIAVKMSELSGLKMAHVARRLPKLKEYLLAYGQSASIRLNPLRIRKTGSALDRYLRYYTKAIVDPSQPVEAWQVRPIRDLIEARGEVPDDAAVRAFQLAEAHRVIYRTNNRAFASLPPPATPIARVRTATGAEYVWWEGRQMLFLADHLDEYVGDLWTDLSTINLNKEGGVAFRNGKKPEALIERILRWTTDPGDAVLDPFAGSGTTAAVAHKLGRRWVTIEQGPQVRTHVVPRLERVVAGEDPGGITRTVGWTGGGGFSVDPDSFWQVTES